MPRATPILIVTSSRPRVGKTLIARVLVEYFRAQRQPVAAFDVNPDEFALVDYLPGYTAAASLSDVRGEMALFDQLVADDNVPKVVDVGHVMFERFFALMQQIDFLAEAQRRALAPMVLFVADPDDRAKQGYAALSARFPGLALVPVLNEAVPVVARYRESFPPTRGGGGQSILLPALSDVLRSIIDRRTFSFIEYIAKTTDPTAELYEWTRRVFIVMRELELRLLVQERRPPLQQSA
jgi:hypothetical protein